MYETDISVAGLEYINAKHWKDNQMPKNVTKPVYWGKEQAEFGDHSHAVRKKTIRHDVCRCIPLPENSSCTAAPDTL